MHITMQTCLTDNVSSLEPVENTSKVHTGVGVLVRLPKRSSRQKENNHSDFLTVTRVQGRPPDSEYGNDAGQTSRQVNSSSYFVIMAKMLKQPVS